MEKKVFEIKKKKKHKFFFKLNFFFPRKSFFLKSPSLSLFLEKKWDVYKNYKNPSLKKY